MANVNPISGVEFGKERTSRQMRDRAQWERDQAAKIRAAKRPVGWEHIVDAHEQTARAYEQASRKREHEESGAQPSRSRGHAAVKAERRELKDYQLAALRTFAQANGRNWKSALNDAWSTGRYRNYNGADDEGALQEIRNYFGPSWLVRFSFPKQSTHHRSYATVKTAEGIRLQCDMSEGCKEPVTHIEDSGFVYCTKHGLQRRGSGQRCRKLTPSELKRLMRGEKIARY